MNRLKFGLGLFISLFIAVVGVFLAIVGGLSLISVIFYGSPGLSSPLDGLAAWVVSFAMLGSGLILLSHGQRALVVQAKQGPRSEPGHDADTQLRQLAKKLSRPES